MIKVHKLRGEELWVNPDLVEIIEAGPDTVVTLTDGKKLILHESPELVAEAVRAHRSQILAGAFALGTARRPGDDDRHRHLRAVDVENED